MRRAAHLLASIVLAACAVPSPASGQELDEEALNAVVSIFSHGPSRVMSGRTIFGDEGGAGIVVGMDSAWVYIATALHVVAMDVQPWTLADSILVRFRGDPRQARAEVHAAAPSTIDTVGTEVVDGVEIRVLDTIPPLDLALIRVPRAGSLSDAREVFVKTVDGDSIGFVPEWDRFGSASSVRAGALVFPVGCPSGECWEPGAGEFVFSANSVEIEVQSGLVKGGHSGGALFDATGEVVGMILESTGPGARAYSMDFVASALDTLGAWERPVRLSPPRFPRSGYRLTAGTTLLLPTSGGMAPSGRAPSARVTVGFPLARPFELHAGFLRLAPADLGARCPSAITAGAPRSDQLRERERRPCEQLSHMATVGVGLALGSGRFMFRPFGELAMGRVAARYDIGGVYVAADNRYVPLYSGSQQTGFGAGGGFALDLSIVPHVAVRLMGAYWTMQDPFEGVDLPAGYRVEAPSVYYGIGVRWGR